MELDIRDEEKLLDFLEAAFPKGSISYQRILVSPDHILITVRTFEREMEFSFNGQGGFVRAR